MMNPEYDFADGNEVTNEKQADEQSTGDHEDSDGEGLQGPPPPTEFKRLLEEWARDFENGLPSNDCIYRKISPGSKHNDFEKHWKPRQPLNKTRVD